MTNSVATYQGLITSEYAQQPNFQAMIAGVAAVYVQIQNTLLAMSDTVFDVDLAVGEQLDEIGLWVDESRNIAVPISGVYFSWDTTQAQGWDYGTWQPSSLPAQITSLPNDAYRLLLYAKIAANNWDGTTDGAYAIWNALFASTGYTILIEDYENMTYALAVVGGIVDSLTLALITGGYIPLRPEGVEIVGYYVSSDTNPSFAWDVESPLLQGCDQG